MKTSFYNIYAPNNRNVICYNTKNDIFSVLSCIDYHFLITDLNTLQIQSPNVYNQLIEKGFIIDDNYIEIEDLSKEYRIASISESDFYLTILPTLDCNLRCWYCFEKHKKGSHLTDSVSEAIFNFVKNILKAKPKIQRIHVELFGGEPLLYFQNELYPLLNRIKEYVEQQKKEVSFFFVTNSVCITQNSYALFKQINASFQISIDGYKDKHNSIKFIPGNTKEGTYSHVIRVIKELTSNIENVYINLRINYDDETLEYMENLINDLIDVDRKKIGVHLERVWQTSHQIKKDNDILKRVIDNWQKHGFRVSYMNLSRRSYSCKASLFNQCTISYDGAIYKCTGRDFTKELQEGSLLNDGSVLWEQDKLDRRLSIVTYDNHLCKQCKLLPLCWGPCSQKLIENKSESIERFCQKELMELSMSNYIRFRFNNSYISNQLYKEK